MARELVRGRYRLDARLGAGGMSEVWTAEDLELGRRVALKLLGHDADPARFQREAHAVASLAHPNICRLYDYGEADGRPFMVLEYLGGGTLEDRLLPGEPYPDDEAERIARELAAGLAHAHARDLVHRDLKPANVLFDDEGTAKIADFGIARLGGSGTLTETGTLLGTAAYLSPEQAQGQPATAASDVYSFGVILYRLLAGRLPFEAASPIELARMHVHERPAPLGEVRPDAPPALAALAEASLAKDPQERPADGAALATALATGQPTLSGAPTLVAGADSTLVIPRRRRSGRRRLPVPPVPLPLLLVALLLFAAAAAGVAIAFLAGRSSGSKPPPSSAAQRTRSRGTSTTLPITSASARTKTTASTTRATTTSPTAVSPPPPPPTPPPPPPPPTTVPPPPTTLPTTVTIPITTPPPPPPPLP